MHLVEFVLIPKTFSICWELNFVKEPLRSLFGSKLARLAFLPTGWNVQTSLAPEMSCVRCVKIIYLWSNKILWEKSDFFQWKYSCPCFQNTNTSTVFIYSLFNILQLWCIIKKWLQWLQCQCTLATGILRSGGCRSPDASSMHSMDPVSPSLTTPSRCCRSIQKGLGQTTAQFYVPVSSCPL